MPDGRPDFLYAVLPYRAIGDDRLHGLHWKAVAAVAFHDRLGKNGQGCWASYGRLAEMCGCTMTGLAKAISDLVEWGYLRRERNPRNRRMRVLRVIYHENEQSLVDIEETADSCPVGHDWATDHCPVEQEWESEPVSGPWSAGNGDGSASIIGLQDNNRAPTLVPHDKLKSISLSESKKNAGEPAPDGAAENEERRETAAYLRKLTDYLKEIDGRPLRKGERQYLAHAMKRCAETADAILYDGT